VSPRPFVAHNSADVYDCLIYGNLRHAMRVHHIGHDSDLALAAKENCGGPQTAGPPADTKEATSSVPEAPWFTADGRISIPSNLEDVDGTLIRFVYQIGLNQDSSSTYKMFFDYWAAPVSAEKFHGSIEALSVQPSDKNVQFALEKTGRKGGLINLSKYEDHFEIPMSIPSRRFLVQSQQYIFMDSNRKPVGEIYAPFLVPER
jgi:hypothetical protein